MEAGRKADSRPLPWPSLQPPSLPPGKLFPEAQLPGSLLREALSTPTPPVSMSPFLPSPLSYLPQQPNSKWLAPAMHACVSSSPGGLQEACRLGGSRTALGMEGGQPERRKGDALGFHFSLSKAGGKAGALPSPLKTRKVWASRGSSNLFL